MTILELPLNTLRYIFTNPLIFWILMAAFFLAAGITAHNLNSVQPDSITDQLEGGEKFEWSFSADAAGWLELSSQDFFAVARNDEIEETAAYASSWDEKRGQVSSILIPAHSIWSISGEDVHWTFSPLEWGTPQLSIVRFGPLGRTDTFTPRLLFGLSALCGALWLGNVILHFSRF